jgi:hypothetical protein
MVLTVSAPVAAQSTYVGGSLMGELTRLGGLDVDDGDVRIAAGLEPLSRDGETLGFDVRVGRALGERWGIELSFARGGTLEERRTRNVFDILTSQGILTPILPGVPSLPTLPPFPITNVEIELVSERQHTTIDTVAWLRQPLGDRVSLAFLGGVSFSRVETEQQVGITDTRLAIHPPFSNEIETVQYGTGAVVGSEAIIKLSDHAAVTGGVRLHGVAGGWLIRPAAGLRWQF